MIPDNLPPGLTVRDLYHIMGDAEGEDSEALVESQFDEDDRIRDERLVQCSVEYRDGTVEAVK